MAKQDALTDLRRLADHGVVWPADLPGTTLPTKGFIDAAVLLLFGAGTAELPPRPLLPSDLNLLFVERASTLRDHPGQVAFPGGRLDATDPGPIEAAMREAEEETGLLSAGVEILGALDALPLAVSNHRVTPVLSWWRQPAPIGVVDAAECARVFTVPIPELTNPENRMTARLSRRGNMHVGPAFQLDDTVIWGFTGMVLSHLLKSLGWEDAWDTERVLSIDH